MIVTTIGEDSLNTISLPQKVTGRYWLHTGANGGSALASIEGVGGEWVITPSRRVHLLDSKGGSLKSCTVSPMKVYEFQLADGKKIYVFAEPLTEDRQVFRKYLARDDVDLTIGRSEQSDICFANRTVSSQHAVLSSAGGQWQVRDLNSLNGTFVNQRRVGTTSLSYGDSIFIMGMKIIVGQYFIAVNNPDGQVRLSGKLKKYVSQPVAPVDEEEEYELSEPPYFYRSPRFKRDIKPAVFRVDPPTASPIREEMPWPLVMGSSMAMGMMSMVTLTSAIASSNYTSMAMGASMLASTLLLPTITRSYEKRQNQRREELRQKKYREYLDRISARISEACQLQTEILRENGVTTRDCEDRILNLRHDLWERGPSQDDFLTVRLGSGTGFLNAQFNYSEKTFSLDNDNLQEELYALCERPNPLRDIPITYSLFSDRVSGVIGEREQLVSFAKGLIIQLAALYSCDEVKFVFFLDPEMEDMAFVKWLPHVWSDDGQFRFIATNPDEAREVAAFLENVIDARLGRDGDKKSSTPYYIFFSLNKPLAARTELFKQILPGGPDLNMSVITFYEALNLLPKECSMVVDLRDEKGRLYDRNSITGEPVEFTPDVALSTDPLRLSTRLANVTLDQQASNYSLPGLITYLEMFGVGQVEHLNPLTRWRENDPTKSLGAPVGVDTMGDLFKLDLHEKFHGPHGLIAGMTGSGKSEFIISYILSLAVNYHPYEVAFILIDYKGGGMAKTFENLPHTAGIITNLDGAAIKRSLVSIESELKRRQAIFAEASKKISVSNIDIYKYQKLYREGTVSEPLQHLFIIADEFAELKTQQPDFMANLISAARIGRSLGVHLILATQKPSGVVDDQIWSNSKFRVCLKVQERADSMDMLKRPDAAELKETGRFYLQVGYNELFELGQSAWAGAPYLPSDKVVREKDNSVAVVDMNGHIIREVKPTRKQAGSENARKQVDVITQYLRRIADDEGIHIRPLWQQPIPAFVLLDDIRKKYAVQPEPYKLDPVIGEYDDPARQSQGVLTLPLSEDGNTIIYGAAGSGKDMLLEAMLCSLLTEHTPEEVNIYLMDFASETLRAFAAAPHVGDVVLAHEAEKAANLVKMLHKETETRKKLFADHGGDYGSYIQFSGSKLPAIVVVISNFAAFTETYEDLEDAIYNLSREGTKYGIYFVITAMGVGSVRFRMLQNFKQLLALQLNDETDYTSILGKTEGLVPSKFEGRGLVRRDELYEFQTARITADAISFTFIQQMCVRLSSEWQGATAPGVPVLPERVDSEFLQAHPIVQESLSVPIGVEKASLKIHYHPFGASYISTIMSGGREYQRFIGDLAAFIGSGTNWEGIIFDLPQSVRRPTGALRLCSSRKDCETEISALFDLVVQRNNTFKDALEQNRQPEPFGKYLVVINSLSALQGALSDKGKEMLSLILEKGSTDYNLAVIVADQASVFSNLSFEKWYSTQVDPACGVWVGSGITDQYQLKPSRTTAEMRETITDEFGFALTDGVCVLLKLLQEDLEE